MLISTSVAQVEMSNRGVTGVLMLMTVFWVVWLIALIAVFMSSAL
jgi:hypothetical protein